MIKEKNRVYDGHFKIYELTIESKGKTFKREVLVRKNVVASLVYDTTKDKYIFVSQWRPGSESKLIEIVAGTLEEGEDPIDAMKREILEEVGYKTDLIFKVAQCYLSPGGTTEFIDIFYSEVSEKVSEGGGLEEENEDIEILEFDKKELDKNYEDNNFLDAKTLISIKFAGFMCFIKNNSHQ